MAYSVPVENYVRSPQPVLPESQSKYINEEFKKLERVLATVNAALSDLSTSSGGSGGSGTVTSVGMSVPTGLSVTGSPITSSGTLAVSLASGYSIPSTASQSAWDAAYGWGNHASAGYATANSIALITGDMLGFIDRTSTTLSFNESTRTFTITPTGSTWSVYYRGNLLTVTGAKSVVIPNTTGAYFIRLNPSTLVLESYGPIPDFANDVIMAYIYWNATTGQALIVGDERHGSQRDTTWHSNQHLNLGTVWRSGGSLSYTLNSDAAIQFGVGTPLLIADEDLVHTITHSASPSADYQQILTSAASVEVLYLEGTEYAASTASTTPWIAGVSTARYNPVVSSSGSLADAGEGKYITYWLLATNDIRRPVKLVMGRTAWDSVDAAYGEVFENYGLNFAEQVFMYQIVLRTSTSYSNTPKVVIAAVRKITDRVPSSTSTYSAGAHGDLTGRDSANQHPIGAIINLQTSLDAKQATLVSGTNIKTVNSTSLLGSGDVTVQPTLVSGTNIKTVNSTSLLGSGDVAVQPTLVSGTNIKTVNGNTLLGSGDISITGGDITNTEASLSADVQMPTSGTWYNGPSVTLGAGTWLITGHVTFWRTATTATTWFGRISDGTNHHASGQMYTASLAGIGGVMTLTAVVTLTGSTTIRIQGTTSAGATACLMKAATTANGSGNNATQITAIQLS